MTISISYMGTKKSLAPVVAEVVSASPPGPLLDVFSGLCAVAKSVAPARQTWTNDLQHFAQSVAQAHFCSQSHPPQRIDVVAKLNQHYSKHLSKQEKIAGNRIAAESKALADYDSVRLNDIYAEWIMYGPLDGGFEQTGDATLFRDTFAGAYFGLLQCIEIDALRHSLDIMLDEHQIDSDQHRWLILALAVALNRCASSTGHFAQPLTAKPANLPRFAQQRQRSVKDCFLSAIESLEPVGNTDWRSRNIAMRGEANSALSSFIGNSDGVPSVVYADPPYTSDQYSRYYHLYETIVLYDYPEAEGKGRYRTDREASDFCLSSRVSEAFDKLISNCVEIGADLVLSYPTNGLLANSRDVLPQKIKDKYGRDPQILEIDHRHSTMGGSKGPGKMNVTEIIYRAYP
ncbi:DNA adenine methylase [Roseovarius pelagicus]|uniref:DNA adenine methylase n=1 Tax=Roseovarius pelagicus TaxID=2980108 RepID=A0ABY6D6K5_9RHOB|nr:DNA adenine methylase [Roseovarius pelagicus]UXX81777.1 DNA adenine methylase [Roseovarius pelagicus]